MLYLDKINVLMIIVLLDLSTLAKLAKIPHKGVEILLTKLLYGGGKRADRRAGYSEINNRLDKQLGKYMKKVLLVLKQLLFY